MYNGSRTLEIMLARVLCIMATQTGKLLKLCWQGIQFVDKSYSILKKRGVAKDKVDAEIKKWLFFLMQLVDFTEECVMDLRLFMNGQYLVLKNYWGSTKQIVNCIEISFVFYK